MALYRLGVCLHSAIATPLKGDTLWGHVVWGIARHEGDDAVQAFIEEERLAAPPFAVSSAFLRGFIPAPIRPPTERDETMEKAKYAEIKKLKKLKYTPAAQYIDGAQSTAAEDGKMPFKALGHSHVGINRMTGAAEEGMLYAMNEMRLDSSPSGNVEPCKRNGYLDIYIASSYDSARVTELMKRAFEGGFGAGASRGMGNITVEGEAVEVHPSKRLINGSEAAGGAVYGIESFCTACGG